MNESLPPIYLAPRLALPRHRESTSKFVRYVMFANMVMRQASTLTETKVNICGYPGDLGTYPCSVPRSVDLKEMNFDLLGAL